MKCECGRKLSEIWGWKVYEVTPNVGELMEQFKAPLKDFITYKKKCKCGIVWLYRPEIRPEGQIADFVKSKRLKDG